MEQLPSQLFTPEQIAEHMGLDREQIYLWMSDDKLRYEEVPGGNGTYWIHWAEFSAALDNLYDLSEDLEAIDRTVAKRAAEIDTLNDIWDNDSPIA